MYKKLKSVVFIGGIKTGKSTLLKKYIEEVIKQESNVIIIDPKQVEFSSYCNNCKVIYINNNIYEELKENIKNYQKNIKLIFLLMSMLKYLRKKPLN